MQTHSPLKSESSTLFEFCMISLYHYANQTMSSLPYSITPSLGIPHHSSLRSTPHLTSICSNFTTPLNSDFEFGRIIFCCHQQTVHYRTKARTRSKIFHTMQIQTGNKTYHIYMYNVLYPPHHLSMC